MKGMYFTRDGKPIDSGQEWAEEFQKSDRHVADTRLWWGGRVSTIYLGLNHNYGDGEPLIFETMVFPKSGWGDLDMDRYSTEEQAKEGHRQMIRKWKNPLMVLYNFRDIFKKARWFSLGDE